MPSTQIIGLDSFIEGVSLAAKEARPVVRKAALDIALMVRRKAQANVAKKTTTLAQSIIAEPVPEGAMTTVQEKYGLYLEEGTGLYGPFHEIIYPSTAQALHWEEGGMDVFAKYTKGMEAQPFFWPAVDDTEPFIIERMGMAAKELINMAVKA